MATIILTAVGSFLGGPIGGAIGGAIGQSIDRAIIGGGKAREGPRLKDLAVQTSSYGAQIPAIFGAMRVAGTVIWSTDLIERRAKSGGGKGRPSTINYSYSASFAVALSSRPLARIGRIWADGNLLRGAAGDFKVQTGFRFYHGNADQPVDPLLSSADGAGQSPAYRGFAYVVFEDLQLADFGNRIPSLTFEIFERDDVVPLHILAQQASRGALSGLTPLGVGGYALQGSDCRSALAPLLASFPVDVRPNGEGLELRDWSQAGTAHRADDPAILDGSTKLDRPLSSRESTTKAPASLAVRYYDPARDFQTGLQTSRHIGAGRAEVQVDLPATITAETARSLAEAQLLARWRGLDGAALALPMAQDGFRPGDDLTLPDGRVMRVGQVEHMRGSAKIDATLAARNLPDSLAASSGRNVLQPDLVVGPTQLYLLDLPALGSDDPGRPLVVAAAAGVAAGWRSASLSLVDGGRAIDIGETSGVASIGELVTPLPAHSALLFDSGNQPVVRLGHDAMILPPGTGDPGDFDAPMLAIGDEIIRYGTAQKVGPRDYRLAGLIRGVAGSDAAPAHASGDRCILLEQATLTAFNTLPLQSGTVLTIEALGLGDEVPVAASLTVTGRAITPVPPVHGRFERMGNGDVRLDWVRRDRLLRAWADGSDIPDSESVSSYTVALNAGATRLSEWSSDAESLLISAAEWNALGLAAGTPLQFSVIQQGRLARSAPLLIPILF